MTPVNALGQPYRRKQELIFGNTDFIRVFHIL